MINEIQPKMKFQNIVQCPFNIQMDKLHWALKFSLCTQYLTYATVGVFFCLQGESGLPGYKGELGLKGVRVSVHE